MRYGFTLVEVLVAMMILGLSIGGLLNIMRWGQMNYAEITSSWRQQAALSGFHREIRKMVAGGIAPDRLSDMLTRRFFPEKSGLGLETMDVRPYGGDAFFITCAFFEDANKNGLRDPNEERFSRVWCFRRRDAV